LQGSPSSFTGFLFLRYQLYHFKIWAEILDTFGMIIIISRRNGSLTKAWSEMGEVIRFVSKSERERARLIREARAIYESIFPSAEPVREPQAKVAIGLSVGGANAHRSGAGSMS
jgi:hypothetical protein